MSPMNEQEKAIRAAHRHFSALCGGGVMDLSRVEAMAIESAVRAFESDEALGLLRLWAAVRNISHPLVGRTLSFLLTQRREPRPNFVEIVALDLMASRETDDSSTLLNLVTAAQTWLRSDASVPKSILAELPGFVRRHLNQQQAPIVRDATVELLVTLAETASFSLFPQRVVSALIDDLCAPRSAFTADEESALNDQEWVTNRAKNQGIKDAEFYENVRQALNALAETLDSQMRAAPHETALALAYSFVQRYVFEARARASSSKVGAPVQAIRVADETKRPTFSVVSAVIDSWRELFESTCEAMQMAPVLRPLEAGAGSFLINAAVDGAPDAHLAFDALRRLVKVDPSALGDGLITAQVDAKTYRALLEVLAQHRATLEVTMVDANNELTTPCEAIIFGFSMAESLLPPVREASSKLSSGEIPQADDLGRVFRLIDLLNAGAAVTAESLDVTPRQVNYYRQAGRILGLLSEKNTLTTAGEQVARLDGDQRRMSVSVLFEESACCSTWIRWARVSTLAQLDPESANKFLVEAAPSLSHVTANRRAQTLAAWQRELAPFHYAQWRK